MGTHPKKDSMPGHYVPSHLGWFVIEECRGLGPEGVAGAKMELYPGKIYFTLLHPLVQFWRLFWKS